MPVLLVVLFLVFGWLLYSRVIEGSDSPSGNDTQIEVRADRDQLVRDQQITLLTQSIPYNTPIPAVRQILSSRGGEETNTTRNGDKTSYFFTFAEPKPGFKVEVIGKDGRYLGLRPNN